MKPVKRPLSKLVVSRESLVQLTDQRLVAVAGGTGDCLMCPSITWYASTSFTKKFMV